RCCSTIIAHFSAWYQAGESFFLGDQTVGTAKHPASFRRGWQDALGYPRGSAIHRTTHSHPLCCEAASDHSQLGYCSGASPRLSRTIGSVVAPSAGSTRSSVTSNSH